MLKAIGLPQKHREVALQIELMVKFVLGSTTDYGGGTSVPGAYIIRTEKKGKINKGKH